MEKVTEAEHMHAEVVTDFLSAMANPKRLLILKILVTGEIAVGALAARVGLSQSALSQHLSKLRAQNLVTTRRDAQTIYYSSHSDAVMILLDAVDRIYGTTGATIAQKKLRIV